MIVGAPNVERVRPLESEDDPILVVHADRVPASEVTAEHVQPITRRHLQVVQPLYRVDLVELPAHDGPQISRDAPGGFGVDAVPDVPCRVIGQRPDHQLAL